MSVGQEHRWPLVEFGSRPKETDSAWFRTNTNEFNLYDLTLSAMKKSKLNSTGPTYCNIIFKFTHVYSKEIGEKK